MNISYEFFPARTEQGKQNLNATLGKFDATNPDFYSVTFGALGSAQDATFDTIGQLTSTTKVSVAPHLTCVGSDKEQMTRLLDEYTRLGVKRVVVLRGDVPPAIRDIGEFHYANELVEFIKRNYADQFSIDVAAYPEKHPQSKTVATDIEHFVNKVKAGADGAITQYFYNIDAYFHFVDEVQQLGADIPIVPGIMPITNYDQLARFSKICDADIPTWILNRLEMYRDDIDSLRAFGLDVVSEMCLQMKIRGVNDFHFYTMNRSEPALSIANNIS
ncbi:MAG: methylenetetrahydrofolate reductase [NAD(P)H] [Gammaproteobacteria bacterium]|nr:methylenetetrahydrofolate reductase [NAD(P)H] [Gammaproteobacteria bacterium]